MIASNATEAGFKVRTAKIGDSRWFSERGGRPVTALVRDVDHEGARVAREGRVMRMTLPLLCSLILLAGFVAPARAQQNLRLAEYAIKVGLLYNFLHYTQWPQDAPQAGPLNVCVYGADPFDGRLAVMADRTVDQRGIRLQSLHAISDARACSMLFVSAAQRSDWPQIRAMLTNRGVLTVSDFDGFADAGGMIEFTHVRDHVGIRINSGAVAAARLSIQDRLLRLADATGEP